MNKLIILILLFLFSLYSSFLILTTAAVFNSDTSLSLLAHQFINGHISLAPTKELPLGDISFFNNRFYLYFGPFASIALMPFVFIFGKTFPQVFLGIASMAISLSAIYFITKSFKFEKLASLWLAVFYVFSTVLFSASLINISAYLVQALGASLVLVSLYFYISKKNPLSAGIFLGLAVLTRFILILAVIFFIVEFLQKRLKPRQLVLLFSPVVIALLILGTYNFVRFDSFLETGYKYASAYKTYPQSLNLEHGLFNISHLPANLYTFFIKPPAPVLENPKGFFLQFPYLKADPWGMAIWFTSPLFLMLIFKFKKYKYTASAFVSTVALSIPAFLFYSIGFAQFGYRYTLDFLPFLFLLLIPSLGPKLSNKAILLIIIGVIFNCIYITSLWGVYPHFGIK